MLFLAVITVWGETMKKKSNNLIIKLIVGVALGLGIGLVCPKSLMVVIVTIKYILGQIIFFAVPLIIIGFIAPSITKLKTNATKKIGRAHV